MILERIEGVISEAADKVLKEGSGQGAVLVNDFHVFYNIPQLAAVLAGTLMKKVDHSLSERAKRGIRLLFIAEYHMPVDIHDARSFSRIVRMPLPDESDRRKIIDYLLEKTGLDCDALNKKELLNYTKGLTSFQMYNAISNASNRATLDGKRNLSSEFLYGILMGLQLPIKEAMQDMEMDGDEGNTGQADIPQGMYS